VARRKQEEREVGLRRSHFMVPIDLHKRLKRIAVEDEVSMSKIVTELIEVYVEKRERELSK